MQHLFNFQIPNDFWQFIYWMILLFLPLTSGSYTQNCAKEYHLLKISFRQVCSWPQLVNFWSKTYWLSLVIMYYANKKEIDISNSNNSNNSNTNNNNPGY